VVPFDNLKVKNGFKQPIAKMFTIEDRDILK
jgi:hypothetical protein